MIVNYFYSPNLPKVLHQDLDPYVFNTQLGYHKCYAYKWAVLNRFKVKCPYDLDFSVNYNKDKEDFLITFNNNTAERSFNECVIVNPQKSFTVDKNKFIFQIKLKTSFYTKEKCFMEMNHPEHLDVNLKLIKGKYDISQWLRPINASFEVQKLPCRIILSRESILCELIFHANKINEPIKLKENTNPSYDLIELAEGNAQVSSYVKSAKTLIKKGTQLLKRYI